MSNKKGFTLVELLVVMVVLGVVVGLSIPMLRNMSSANDNRQYKTYSQSVLSGSKMYVDSYEEDLFGREDYGCALITYDQLVEKRLLKDILVNDISCNSDKTLVKVVKFDGQVFYKTYLGCGPEKNGRVSKITILYPDEETPTPETCAGPGSGDPSGGGGGNTISITATPDSTGKYDRKQKKSNVILTSSLGIRTEAVIYYAWRQDTNYAAVTDWQKLDLQIPSKSKQMSTISKAENVVVTSGDLLTPKGGTGDYNLLLRVDRLDNLAEKPWINQEDPTSKYLNFGPFKVDNTPPVFNDSTVISSSSEYNNVKPKLSLKATDNLTAKKDLRMCISFDENTCKTTNNEIKSYKKYSENKTLDEISNSYNGSAHKVHITVADLAGNYVYKSFDYQVAQKYTLTYNNKGGTGCTSKDVTFNVGTTVTWGDLCTPTRVGYKFNGWKTSGGVVVTKDTTATGNITVEAQWSINKVNITYNVNGGTMATNHGDAYSIDSNGIVNKDSKVYVVSIGYNSTLSSNGLLDYKNSGAVNISRTGYKIINTAVWNTRADGTGKSYDQTTQYAASEFCDISENSCDIVLYANWNKNTIKIKYDVNGGSMLADHGSIYSIGSDSIINKNNKVYYTTTEYGGNIGTNGLANYNNTSAINISKTNYTINSGEVWNTKADGSGTSFDQTTNYLGSNFCDASVNDCEVTLYANWKHIVIKIKYNVNGGGMASNHGTAYAVDSNGYITKDGEVFYKTVNLGSTLDSNGLCDVNNSNYVNLAKTNYRLDTTKAWNTAADGSGTSFDQTTQYESSNFYTDSYEIVLYANWILDKPGKPTITNSSGGKWTNGKVTLTFSSSFPTNLIGKWYYKEGSDSYSELSSSALTKDYSTEMEKTISVIVCNKKASGVSDSDNCSAAATSNVKIDKTKPNPPQMKAIFTDPSDNVTFYTSSYGTGNRGSLVLPYQAGSSCSQAATRCDSEMDIKWKPSDDTGTIKSGISHYILNFDCQCYNSSNNGKRNTPNYTDPYARCDLGSRNPNWDCTRVSNKKITGVKVGTEYGVDSYAPSGGFFSGHAGYFQYEGGYIGQSWGQFSIYAVDNAGNVSSTTSWGAVYCTQECNSDGYKTRNTSAKP